MANHWVLRTLVVLTLLPDMAGIVRAEPPLDEKALAEEFRALAKQAASAYTIRLDGRYRPLTLRPEPVLKWSNPVVATDFGEVFFPLRRGGQAVRE